MDTRETGANRGHRGRVSREPKPLSREELLARWKDARYDDVEHYPAGQNKDLNGNIFDYDAGARLVILGEDVMDSCETPWAKQSVKLAFEALEKKEDIKVLERGFGMGIVATRVIHYLRVLGGNYTCIELNDQVADYADGEWRMQQERGAQGVMGADSNESADIGIEIIRGDAVEETKKLAEEGNKYDIIISDTYPLSKDEEGVNDISDLETIMRCLNEGGVFVFFSFHPGLEGDLDNRQGDLVANQFDNVQRDRVNIKPPVSYRYLNTENGAITKLPVIICKKPVTKQS